VETQRSIIMFLPRMKNGSKCCDSATLTSASSTTAIPAKTISVFSPHSIWWEEPVFARMHGLPVFGTIFGSFW